MRPTALLLSAALLCAVSFRSPLDAQGSAPAPAAPIEDVLSATVVFEGVVIEPDGAPAVGAVVVAPAERRSRIGTAASVSRPLSRSEPRACRSRRSAAAIAA